MTTVFHWQSTQFENVHLLKERQVRHVDVEKKNIYISFTMMKNKAKQHFFRSLVQQHWRLHHSFSSCHVIEFLPSPCRAARVIWQRHLTRKVTSEFTLENLPSYIYPLLCCCCCQIVLALSYFYKMFLCNMHCVCVCVYVCIYIIANNTIITIWLFTRNVMIIISLSTVCDVFMHTIKQHKC